MYLSKQHEFQVQIKYTIHSQSDSVQIQCLHGMAVDAYFLEYNSPWSQPSSLKIQRAWHRG